jgi:hypothetical protein
MSRNLLAVVDARSPFFNTSSSHLRCTRLQRPAGRSGILLDVIVFSANEFLSAAEDRNSKCLFRN